MKTLSRRLAALEGRNSASEDTLIFYISGGDIAKEPIKASVYGVDKVVSDPGETERDFWIRVHATACAGHPLHDLDRSQLETAMRDGEAQYEKYLAAPSHGDLVRVTVW